VRENRQPTTDHPHLKTYNPLQQTLPTPATELKYIQQGGAPWAKTPVTVNLPSDANISVEQRTEFHKCL